MKTADLRTGDTYAAFDHDRHRVACLDPEPRWANRPLAGQGNGLIRRLDRRWTLPDSTWDGALIASLLVVEPFDARRHGHRRGWPLFVMSFDRPGLAPLLVPRAIYAQGVTPWDEYQSRVDTARAVAAASAARWASPEGQADRKREEDERRRLAAIRARQNEDQGREAKAVIAALAALGVECMLHRWEGAITIKVADARRLLAELAEDEMVLAVLGA